MGYLTDAVCRLLRAKPAFNFYKEMFLLLTPNKPPLINHRYSCDNLFSQNKKTRTDLECSLLLLQCRQLRPSLTFLLYKVTFNLIFKRSGPGCFTNNRYINTLEQTLKSALELHLALQLWSVQDWLPPSSLSCSI